MCHKYKLYTGLWTLVQINIKYIIYLYVNYILKWQYFGFILLYKNAFKI